jgi:hypothetical protein
MRTTLPLIQFKSLLNQHEYHSTDKEFGSSSQVFHSTIGMVSITLDQVKDKGNFLLMFN